ncbi:PREDICTED: cyclin-D1-binding protein 1 [Nanorana parkeri]|uniref:cyclin-D1-binding protein 1 n=1 Tax=Nanorana parkeri TaxID=125878 RepID=UPI000854A95B|nr:PREDICTED: cyclin-D1-binding protein 1 [Nanorana parkeri]
MEPLQKLVDNLRAVLGKLRDGESREGSNFNPQFWETLGQAIKATSQEATKISLAYSKPPLPSEEDCQKLSDGLLNAILAASTLYYSLPKNQGITLRKTVREAVADVIEGTMQLLEVILNSRIQSLTQAQLVSTGSVWEACDQFEQIPKDNHAAVVIIVSGYLGVVKDALEEMEQALAGGEDPFSDVLEDDEMGARGNQDTYWSEADHRLIAPCLGLMKASKACLKKVLGALKTHGKVETADQVAQLDDLADITQEVSPSVDELALSMYPPMNQAAVRLNAAKLSSVLKKVLEITRSSHVCPDSETSWVPFLNNAIDHNMNKVKNLTQNAL